MVITETDRCKARNPVTCIGLHTPISQGLQMLRELMVFDFLLNRITDNYTKGEYSQFLELLINLCTI